MVKAAMTDIMAPAIRSIPLRLVQGFFSGHHGSGHTVYTAPSSTRIFQFQHGHAREARPRAACPRPRPRLAPRRRCSARRRRRRRLPTRAAATCGAGGWGDGVRGAPAATSGADGWGGPLLLASSPHAPLFPTALQSSHPVCSSVGLSFTLPSSTRMIHSHSPLLHPPALRPPDSPLSRASPPPPSPPHPSRRRRTAPVRRRRPPR